MVTQSDRFRICKEVGKAHKVGSCRPVNTFREANGGRCMHCILHLLYESLSIYRMEENGPRPKQVALDERDGDRGIKWVLANSDACYAGFYRREAAKGIVTNNFYSREPFAKPSEVNDFIPLNG